MQIQAIASKPSFDIQAALDSPAVRAVARVLASIGVERPTTAKIKVSVLEAKMASLDPVKRIEIKRSLDSVGLIDWNA
jgi:hypothetical protein